MTEVDAQIARAREAMARISADYRDTAIGHTPADEARAP